MRIVIYSMYTSFFLEDEGQVVGGGDLASREGFYEERLRHAFWQRAKSQQKIKG